MKISIVIPSNNEAVYVEELLHFIGQHSQKKNIEEIIIVESFNNDKMIKLAEKTHAKLFYNLHPNHNIQMEIGAFQAKGEIVYFIKPAQLPPPHFDERIIKFVAQHYAMGSLDYGILQQEPFWVRCYKKIMKVFFKNWENGNSFFVNSAIYHQIGGLKKHNNYLKLRKEAISLNYKTK